MSAWVLLLHLSLLPFARSFESYHGHCPSGFIKGNKKCYKLFTEKKTWFIANRECADIQSHLAIIDSPVDDSQIRTLLDSAEAEGCTDSRLLNNTAWILGLRGRVGGASYFDWNDGAEFVMPMNYTNWRAGQPDLESSIHDCVHLNQDLTWTAAPCNDDHCFLCQTNKFHYRDCPTGFVDSKNQKCYRLFKQRKTWDRANYFCNYYDSWSAIIESTDDFELLKELLDSAEGCAGESYSTYSVWTAGRRAFIHGFVWQISDETTSSINYTNWRAGEPNNALGDEDCLQLHQDLTWNDAPCCYHYCVLCQTKS